MRPCRAHAIMRRIDCLLCRIVVGTEAASVVYQDDRVLAAGGLAADRLGRARVRRARDHQGGAGVPECVQHTRPG
jgi:hypothetical protein